MKCALIYDFDGTLAEGDCAQHSLLPSLGVENIPNFWNKVKLRSQKDDGDEILSYLGLLAEIDMQKGGSQLSEEALMNHGKSIPLFPGVLKWFSRINHYAEKHHIELSHYIVSSGLEAMIRGTKIAKYFKKIYACKYHYDHNGKMASWPALAINYTTKTQFLFRINKGVENAWNHQAVNQFIEPEERNLPFQNMIYFGDGDTDIPSMKLVKEQGGHSLAVFDEKKWGHKKTQKKVEKLIAEERANYVVPALYDEGSQLDVTVKGLLQLMNRKNS